MSDWRSEIDTALDLFTTVAELAGDPILPGEILVEYQEAPHRPPSRLPAGRMAVYCFWGDDCWLKVGKAGRNSNARYTSRHYNPGSAQSTLAASLAKDPRMLRVTGFDSRAPGTWIRLSTHRANLLVPAERSPEFLSLLEAFLHLRLRPRYER